MNVARKGLSLGGVLGYNRKVILKVIHDLGSCSRKDISDVTGLDQATITRAINTLLENGIVSEVGLIKGGRGRRSINLNFSSSGRYMLCLRLQRRSFSLAVFNLRGELVDSEELPILSGTSALKNFSHIKQKIEKKILTYKQIDGIGIAVPGPFLEQDERVILITESPEWQGFDLVPELRSSFESLSFFSTHDAKAAALAEWRHNARNFNAKVLLYISAGQGIGSALVVEGEIYRGAFGLAGEIGHMSIDTNGALCKCGNTGCLELYASRISLIREIRKHKMTKDIEYKSFSDVVDAYKNNDIIVTNEVNKVARYLAHGITNCINFTNPDLIVIGDEYANFGAQFLNEIKKQIKNNLLPSVYKLVKIQLSTLSEDTVLRGTFLDAFSQSYLGSKRHEKT